LVQFAGKSRRDSSDNKHSGSNETDHLRASSRLGQQASLRRPTHCKCRPRGAGTGSTVKGLNVRPETRFDEFSRRVCLCFPPMAKARCRELRCRSPVGSRAHSTAMWCRHDTSIRGQRALGR
jgi:hypothetical protein